MKRAPWNCFPAFDFHYGLCVDEQAYLAECRRLRNSDPPPFVSNGRDAMVHFMVQGMRELALVCIRVRRGIDRNQVVSLLLHEAVHIWQAMEDKIGEDKPGKEIEAYHIQRIAQDLIYWYDDAVKARRAKQ